jgi:hypothetical protein
LLALLLSILLSPAGAATALADVGPASFTQPQAGKSAALGRTIRRSSDDQADPADPTFDSAGPLPSASAVVPPPSTQSAAVARREILFGGNRPAPFRARAPPAA